MAFELLGWVVLCLLGAGEFQDTWARWLHLAGLISRLSLEAVPFSADSSSVSFPHRPHGSRSDPDPETPHHRDREAVDTALFSGYEPRRYVLVPTRPGLGLKLIYSSRNVQFTEKGDVPDGYWVSRKEKSNFPLAPTLESAGTNHTSLYLCASSLSTAPLSQVLAAQKGHLENKEVPSWVAPPQPRGELPPPSAP